MPQPLLKRTVNGVEITLSQAESDAIYAEWAAADAAAAAEAAKALGAANGEALFRRRAARLSAAGDDVAALVLLRKKGL